MVQIWEEFIHNGRLISGTVREEIFDSWKRCKEIGVDPAASPQLPKISESDWNDLRDANRAVIDATEKFAAMLGDLLTEQGVQISITDAQGRLLYYHNFDQSAAENELFSPGDSLSEESCGTTAVGLAIKYKKPFQVVGAEHYRKALHHLACFSEPVMDEGKNLAGILTVSCKCGWLAGWIPAVAASAAKAIGNEVALHRINQTLEENNRQMAATLSVVSDGVVYVKSDRILKINKTMSDFLGKPEEEIVNQRVCDGIIAFPDIEESLKKFDIDNNVEIMIMGAEHNYDCLMNVQPISGIEDSYIMNFTRTDKIQRLARKINKYNAYFTFDDIIGKSFQIKEAITLAKKASNYNYKIIIEGESGTGKEIFAQAIHNSSPRRHKPFITFDCGAVPHELFERELLGYSSADFLHPGYEGKPGKLELANGGTLFLDDVANMPMEVQAKMLRILQEEKMVRRGDGGQIPLDVRIIAASNTNLEKEVRNGNFRGDLFYRLNVVFIRIPPLRERREDIALLAHYFLKKIRPGDMLEIDKKAMNMLERYHWPGNVRELHHAVERASMMCEADKIQKEDFALNILDVTGNEPGRAEMNSLNDQVKNYVIQMLQHTNGNISEAARILNVSRATIYSILNRSH